MIYSDQPKFSASNAIEGKHGLLNVFGDRKWDHKSITEGLGSRWLCQQTAIKPYPACRLTHGAIDLASSLRMSQGDRKVQSLQLEISPLSFSIVGSRLPNKIHPQNEVDAQFSAYYQTALTWLDGNQTGWGVYERLLDSDVSDMLEKVSITSNSSLSDLQTQLTITYSDKTTESKFCEAPLGEPSNPIAVENVKKKYLGLAVPVFGDTRAKEIERVVLALESARVVNVMSLVT